MEGRTIKEPMGARVVAAIMLGMTFIVMVGAMSGCGPAKKANLAVLTVNSVPEGVQVTILSQIIGETPCTYRGELEGDTYLILRKDGYKRATKLVSLKRGVEQQVTITMQPEQGYLYVNSDPSGAEVYLNGAQYLGQTPIRNLPIVIGEYTYELRLENYESFEASLEVDDENIYRKVHKLTPLDAWIQCTTSPSNAELTVNGEPLEATSPVRFPVAPGSYTLTAYVKGYITGKKSFQIGPNETLPFHLALKEGYVPPGMILIPAGEFTMGIDNESPDEGPQHKVIVDAYYIDEREVTNEAYQRTYATHTFKPGDEQLPVLGVTWDEANEYARTIGKRLPTEAEWEKAARGTDARRLYPWGIDFDPELCNTKGVGRAYAKKTGLYRAGASPYGCMDMAGNAYEWTASIYDRYPGNTAIKTEYGNVFRVLRGGSYLTLPFEARCTARHFAKPGTVQLDIGFRCAQDIVQDAGAR